jgi:hypothetical protein
MIGQDEDDDFAPRQPSGKRAKQLSVTATKKRRTTNSAKTPAGAARSAFFVPASATPRPPSRSAPPSRLSFGSSGAPAPQQQQQQQQQQQPAGLCPLCGQDLSGISDTEVGRQAHVNACLDAAAGGGQPAAPAAAAAAAAAGGGPAAEPAHEVWELDDGDDGAFLRHGEGQQSGEQQQDGGDCQPQASPGLGPQPQQQQLLSTSDIQAW